LVYAYVKGAAGLTVDGIYAIQPEITFDAATASSDVTDACVVRAKVTGGLMDDYTVLDGFRLTLGDMNGGSRTYGNGLLFEDDSSMAGTCSLTTGINMALTCTTGISMTNATTGISITASENPLVLGTSGTPLTSATADNKFVEIRATTTATTGDIRGIYTALTMNGGTGLQGEAIRGRTIVTATTTGSHGGHFGLEYGAGGSITGLGAGCRATFMCPNSAISGTVCGGMSELWAEGASSDFSGATHAIHRFVMDGNATGIDTAVNVFDFAGLGTSTQFVAATNATIDHALQVRVNGVTYWIGLYDATTGS
jgi:hypothetical protein